MTVVVAETGEIVECSVDEARALTDRIKVGIETAWHLIKRAYETRAWAALGYESWDDYCAQEFGTARLRLPREERQEVVASLRESGLSTRAIAAATGQSHTQVQRDLPSGTNVPVGPVTGVNGKQYQPTQAPLLGNSSQVSNNSGDIEWFTPSPYIEAARQVMGGIDLDPASTPEANEVVQAERFYTKTDNGLEQPWKGRVWMNPPYAGDVILPFCRRLTEFYDSGDVDQAVVLVNSATETEWFHTLARFASAICFPRRRIKFWHPNKPGDIGPLQGQAVFYLGDNGNWFRQAFCDFGFTVFL